MSASSTNSSVDKDLPNIQANLTATDATSKINVRTGPSLASKALHYGYAGDDVVLTAQSKDADGYIWYNLKFQVSGAEGWVREDFVSPNQIGSSGDQ